MRSFAELFAGRDDAYGVYTIPAGTQPSQRGKLAGIASTKHDPVTPELYDAHLRGERRLGIVPIRLDNTTNWIALDADVYKSPDLHSQLAQKILKLKLPLCITKSKSGGAHVWLFFRVPVPASAARNIAAEMVKKLKLDAKTEIFPKQDQIREGDDGSWINLPYFGPTHCVGLGVDGIQELSLAEFLEYADARIVTPKDLRSASQQADAVDDDASDAPPCVEAMLRDGVEEGGRDNALTQLAVYYSRATPDEWEANVVAAAQDTMHPALSISDASRVIKAVNGKSYQYLCKQQPMASLCDKAACVKRKFGVGRGEAAAQVLVIDRIQKFDGEEPTYRVTMKGMRIDVTADQLFDYNSFRKAALRRLDVILPEMQRAQWVDFINRQLLELERDEQPEDTQNKNRVINLFKDWCNRVAIEESLDKALERRVAYFDGKSLFFVGDHFMPFVSKQIRIDLTKIWLYLRDWGVFEEQHGKLKVWRYPIPPGEDWCRPGERVGKIT